GTLTPLDSLLQVKKSRTSPARKGLCSLRFVLSCPPVGTMKGITEGTCSAFPNSRSGYT
ncbi:unnamed protein product, partial [Ixodes pacificus]